MPDSSLDQLILPHDWQPNVGTRPNVQQKVDVSMGPLGEFAIEVYADGFVVHSKLWGDTLEISNGWSVGRWEGGMEGRREDWRYVL